MGSVGFLLKLSACILIFLILENFCVTCEEQWCYDKPSCGCDTWGSIGSCSGERQSPINIDTKKVKYDTSSGHIYFNNYEDHNIAKKILNSGYNLQIECRPEATIFSSIFRRPYFLRQIHFHWGTKKSNGAEHLINGKRYGMEMHWVHTKNNMSIEEASKESDGLVVLVFFIQKGKGNGRDKRSDEDNAWGTLAKFVKKIPEKGNFRKLKGEFSVGALIKNTHRSSYYRYSGSLTTPPCSESVTWIIFEHPLVISFSVYDIFPSSLFYTNKEENRPMQNNFRPTQDLNGRRVYYYEGHKSVISCIRYCIAQVY